MLLFYAAPEGIDLEAASHQGLSSDDASPLRLHVSLDAARTDATGPILVVDASALPSPPTDTTATGTAVPLDHLPASALQNVDPYRPPQAVAAGGGYVARPVPEDIALLLIHRRGVWDLPKGHQDPGEDIESCALREVREEIGIDELHLLRPLGTTQHAYPDGETYAVKTTYWYLMRTPERSFAPERAEGIRRVAWARWAVARRHVGYDTLRRHMDRIEADVRRALK